MKLKKFRIYNYKSIIDSGYCDLASDITIIVGKNETGKTAVLEALRDFDKDVLEFPPNTVPLDASDILPKIELCFHLDQSEVDKLKSTLNIPLPEEFSSHILNNPLSIIKDSLGQYHLNDPFLSQLLAEKSEGKNNQQASNIQSAKERLTTLLEGQPLPDLNINAKPEELQKSAKELMGIVKSFLPSFSDERKQNLIIEHVRLIIQETNKLTEQSVSLQNKFLNAVTEWMPHFIYISEFIGHFPFSIPVLKIKESEPMVDFARISGLDLDKVIIASDIQKRINILNRHSAIINGEFGNYWQQNHIELVVKPEGESILFGVKEREKTDIFKVEQRSKGFQWFLSFYLRLSAQESKNNIILIDEPGTNLHAKAQKEILKVLEERIASETPVVLSTHSPYIINPMRLDRVRLVMKDSKRGSVLTNHIVKDADSDTLTPIHTASKMDMVQSLPLSDKCNIIVYDLADYYFLNALKGAVKIPGQTEIQLLPCSGEEQNLEQLISFLKGFNFDFRVVMNRRFDDQEKGSQLKKKFGLKDEHMTYIPLEEELATEDLLSRADFYSSVVQEKESDDKSISNSRYFEIHNIDPALAARGLYEKTKSGNLIFSDETINAFQKIFDQILREEKPSVTAELPTKEEPRMILKETLIKEIKPQLPEPPKKTRWFFAGK